MLPSDIWMFNQQHLAHLHNQFHHIAGVLPVLASVSCVLVFLHPHTLSRETFWTTRKTRKSLVCSKPEQAYLSWSSLSRRWTSPVASRPLLRLVSTSPPACNKLSFFWIFCCWQVYSWSRMIARSQSALVSLYFGWMNSSAISVLWNRFKHQMWDIFSITWVLL